MTPTLEALVIFKKWFQSAENFDLYIPLEAQETLVAVFARALTEQAREIERLKNEIVKWENLVLAERHNQRIEENARAQRSYEMIERLRTAIDGDSQ